MCLDSGEIYLRCQDNESTLEYSSNIRAFANPILITVGEFLCYKSVLLGQIFEVQLPEERIL